MRSRDCPGCTVRKTANSSFVSGKRPGSAPRGDQPPLLGHRADRTRRGIPGSATRRDPREGVDRVCERLMEDVGTVGNLGDVALILWAAKAVGADRNGAIERLISLGPAERTHPTVEVAWSLAALCIDDDRRSRASGSPGRPVGGIARTTLPPLSPRSRRGAWWTSIHVSCFADMVYPIHALSLYYGSAGTAVRWMPFRRRHGGSFRSRERKDSGGGITTGGPVR